MKKKLSVKSVCICAICIALCYVLPIAFHSLGLGSVLSPMHIPVLLGGLTCGGFYGLLCGIMGPVLSSLLSGMPPAMALITMLPELMVYGLAGGLMMKAVHTGKLLADVYISQTVAMVLGRIVGGIAKALFVTLIATDQTFGLGIWATSYFVTAFPGIVLHLLLVPALVTTLMTARVLPARYPKLA